MNFDAEKALKRHFSLTHFQILSYKNGVSKEWKKDVNRHKI